MRSAVAARPLPLHALLRCGFRLFHMSGPCAESAKFADMNKASQAASVIRDALAGVDHLLLSMGQREGQEVGVLGNACGGYLTMHALACSKRFVAGVSVGGLADEAMDGITTGGHDRKPFVQVNTFDQFGIVTAPLLLLHGGNDKANPASHARVVYHRLHSRSVPVQLVVYPGDDRPLLTVEHRRDAVSRLCAWMVEHLPSTQSPAFISPAGQWRTR